MPLSEPQSPLGCAERAGRSAAVTVYGSCGLQDRGRQLHVASRTGSHAFPRDLRGSHPRDHGGDGEKVENGVASGEGHAAQRQRVGKSQCLNSRLKEKQTQSSLRLKRRLWHRRRLRKCAVVFDGKWETDRGAGFHSAYFFMINYDKLF